MLARIRYVTRRVDKSGHERWYWQRRGHKLTRLPDNPIERIAMAERLNAAADRSDPAAVEKGTIGWVVAKYRSSDEYAALKSGTTKYYKRYLREIEELGPGLPFASFTRKAVVDFIETYPAAHMRRQCASVLKNLFNLARYYGIVTQDETKDLRLKTNKPRDRLWTEDEIKAWLKAAEQEDPHMSTAFILLQYTAQRPSDVLAMTRPQYNGATIRLRQQKTGALIEVPCHPELRTHLDAVAKESKTMMLVSYRGRAVSYLRFNERWRRITARAAIDGAQARDLRRTAMVNMALAGATAPQIASVSGHSIEETQRILDTYIPRNRDLAEIAITKLVDYRASSTNRDRKV
jgi:integrase